MKIIDFVTHIASASSLLDLPDQSGAARLHSYNFLCSISLCTTTNNIFSEPKITLTLSIFIKRLEKQTVHCGFTQITRYSILHVFILLYEKFLQFDWLRAAVFQLNLKYLHVKITVSMVTKITKQIQKQWRKDFQIFKLKRFKN